MRHLTCGLVILDLRHGHGLDAAAWAPYADLCAVQDTADQNTLVQMYGCEPERLYLVPDDDVLLELADQALQGTLPPAEMERRDKFMPDPHLVPDEAPAPPSEGMLELFARLEAAERRSDTMLRGYQVHSRVPIVGPLIAWVRRNLTSHLREPYLDLTFERQVALNRELVTLLSEVVRRQASLESRITRLEEGNHD
jgi:hypothetical protein